MNVLIVHAHNEPQSFSTALYKLAEETLRGQGHEVQVSDLYAMNWNPVASAADFGARSNPDYLVYALEQREGAKGQTIAADIPAQLGAHSTQAVEGIGTGVTQPHTGICEFDATPVLHEQRYAQVLFKYLDLPADGAMGDVQRFGRLADAVETSGGLESPKGVEGREIVGHFTCEFF